MLLPLGSGAATTTRTWIAAIGDYPAKYGVASNGEATLRMLQAGDGFLDLNLKRLTPGALYAVQFFKGPYLAPTTYWAGHGSDCEGVSDGTLYRLPSYRASSKGTIIRSVYVTAGQLKELNSIPRRIAISFGSGSAARCGGFSFQAPPKPSPTPTPVPSVTPVPTPTPQPTCAPWPPAIAAMLSVLSTPPGLCLLLYTNPTGAPGFLEDAGALYVFDPPTIYYLYAPDNASETLVLAHEVCHAHQDEVARQAGGAPFPEGWFQSKQGRQYIVQTGWYELNGIWHSRTEPVRSAAVHLGIPYFSSPLEENAQMCAIWFDLSLGPKVLRRGAPAQFDWVQKWLPLPTFIHPYTGGN